MNMARLEYWEKNDDMCGIHPRAPRIEKLHIIQISTDVRSTLNIP
jgi:hypothetical protein